MSCPNCKCEKCTGDKNRPRRLKIMSGWAWNATALEAANEVKKELENKSSGTKKDWEEAIEGYFNEIHALNILKHIR